MFIDRNKLEASICRDSFYDFVKRFWSEIVTEKPIWNWHIEEMCHYLQEAAERVFIGLSMKHDILINIPPGSTKSLVCSVMYPAWLWTRMPSCKIMCCSHTFSLAEDLSLLSRDLVQSEKYQLLFPKVLIRSDKNKKHNYENTLGGFRYAAGIDGKFTGRHAHIIVVDDPLDPESALSEAKLKLANRVCSVTLPTRKVDKEVSFRVLVMQRLHQNDPSAVMLNDAKDKEKGTPVKHLNLPGILDTEEVRKRVRPRRLLKKYVNGLLDPIRLTEKHLNRLRAPTKLGEYGFAGQILQYPVPPGGGMFKTLKIKIMVPPPLRHFLQIIRYWDKAGTEGGRGAFTAGVMLGKDKEKRIWVLHSIRFKLDSFEREAIIKQRSQMDVGLISKKKYIVGVEQEPGSGGKESAQATVRNLVGFRVRITRPTGNKTIRADPFSVQVNGGCVYMAPGDWNTEYLEEMMFFPDSTFKDQIDASSGAFELLTRKVTKVGGMW